MRPGRGKILHDSNPGVRLPGMTKKKPPLWEAMEPKVVSVLTLRVYHKGVQMTTITAITAIVGLLTLVLMTVSILADSRQSKAEYIFTEELRKHLEEIGK